MNPTRRRQLRKQYERLSAQYHRIYQHYDCGITLAEHISPKLAELGRALRAIEEEVGVAIAAEA